MMCDMPEDYIYGHRAVAFLDVLGFGSYLDCFEREAILHNREFGVYVSQSANDFIGVFKRAVELLDPKRYDWYLFSDNICITTNSDEIDDLRDLLAVISSLYYHFVKRGYFLRGGIDYGLFIDEESIAIGVPLRNAYNIESEVAVYPRIVTSDRFVDKFKNCVYEGEDVFVNEYDQYLFNGACEIIYLNVFLEVFKSDSVKGRRLFFKEYSKAISKAMKGSLEKEAVFIKYKWLAEQYNDFIDVFVGELAYLDSELEPETDDFIEFVKGQKVEI